LRVKREPVPMRARIGVDISPIRLQTAAQNPTPGEIAGQKRLIAPLLTRDLRRIPTGV
jgi:hypothetical protein